MAKKKRSNRRYSPEFKISVIMDMLENKLSYREVYRKYFPEKVSPGTDFIKRWERIYLEEGEEGLYKERRGRACKMDGVKKGRPPKVKHEIKDDLIAENQRLKERNEYLEAENEYLKKLKALIQEEEARKTERNKK